MSRRNESRGDAEGRLVLGLHPVRELLRAGHHVRRIALAEGRGGSAVLDEILELASAAGVPVEEVARGELDDAAGGIAHQGVAASTSAFPYLGQSALFELLDGLTEPAFLVALDGVTDPHNVGSVARTAEAVGAHGLILPARRAAGVTVAAEKAAAGALAYLPVAKVPNLSQLLVALKPRGIWSVGLDAEAPQELIECRVLDEPVILVVGSEGHGLARLSRVRCDVLVNLPMRGRVGSLNAAVAAGVALFEIRQRRDAG